MVCKYSVPVHQKVVLFTLTKAASSSNGKSWTVAGDKGSRKVSRDFTNGGQKLIRMCLKVVAL